MEEDGQRKAGGRDHGMEEQADVRIQWGWVSRAPPVLLEKHL